MREGFLIEIHRRGGGFSTKRRGRGARRVSAANWGILGGGLIFFCFSGPKCPPRVGLCCLRSIGLVVFSYG